ncbi:hypothetical protein [Pedobacter arcticus]|uniref:hypothetical protein n=1 Tax=Pedobacter arcticus TaxID=752140 RepID=UPI000301FCA5|nr:hypothetical protein [Pedobacter arcticus]
MKIEVGDFVRNAVYRQNAKTITQLGKEIGVSRITVNSLLKKDEMELKYILAFEKSLGLPLLSELKKSRKSLVNIVAEPVAVYETCKEVRDKYELLLREHEDLKDRYIELMENYIKKK